MMGGVTAHTGVEPSVGPKTIDYTSTVAVPVPGIIPGYPPGSLVCDGFVKGSFHKKGRYLM